MSCQAVAKVLYLDDDTVIRTWHQLYQEDGIEGLASFGYEGGACRLTAEQQERLTAWVTLRRCPGRPVRSGHGSRWNAASSDERTFRSHRLVASPGDGTSQADGDLCASWTRRSRRPSSGAMKYC